MILFKHQSHSGMAAGIGFFMAMAVLWLPGSESSPFVISDDRIRSLDVTPVLGRGYSVATNSFQSTCLVVEETTVPSYDYDYYFTDLTSSDTKTKEQTLQGKVSSTFGYWAIKRSLNSQTDRTQTSKFERQKHIVTATMRIERYYSSVKEETSRLTRDAEQLLRNDDYIGFFKSCGPNYVRSIRRAQEVTAIFEFEATSQDQAQEFASTFQLSGWGTSVTASADVQSKFVASTQSLRIKILGFGLGLNEDGSQTLVATSMSEYNDIMKFAFRTMTQSENNIGMVYGLEVVPWVDNTSFQVAAKIEEKQVMVPMPRSIIPRAQTTSINKEEKTKIGFSKANRKYFSCQDGTHQIDKLGFCCHEDSMKAAKAGDESVTKLTVVADASGVITGFKTPRGLELTIEDNALKLKDTDTTISPDGREFRIVDDEKGVSEVLTFDNDKNLRTTGGDVVKLSGKIFYKSDDADELEFNGLSNPLDHKICKPMRSLPPTMKKNNMANNGEFVALLDSLVRYRLNTLFQLEKCITALNSLPKRYDYFYLKAQDTVKYDGAIETRFTVAELRLALDPFDDYALVRHMGDELDEFLDMFYDPCISEIFGLDVGTNAGIDAMFFLAESWLNQESCSKISCLADNMRWDREKGDGCVPSLITGNTDEKYSKDTATEKNNEFCMKKLNDNGEEECAIDSEKKAKYHDDVEFCWKNANGKIRDRAVKSPVYLMNHFCNPVISETGEAPPEVIREIKAWKQSCDEKRAA